MEVHNAGISSKCMGICMHHFPYTKNHSRTVHNITHINVSNAYIHKQQLHFPTAEAVSIKNTILGYTASPSIQSASAELENTNVFIITFCISGGLLLVIVILVTTVLLLLSRRLSRRKSGNTIIIMIMHPSNYYETVDLFPCR